MRLFEVEMAYFNEYGGTTYYRKFCIRCDPRYVQEVAQTVGRSLIQDRYVLTDRVREVYVAEYPVYRVVVQKED
jgi:hypothetical protein